MLIMINRITLIEIKKDRPSFISFEIKIICKDLRSFFVDKNFYYHDTHLNSEGVTILSKIISINGNNFN